MKEKIKLIVLIILFAVLLVVVNNLLSNTDNVQNVSENMIENKIENNTTIITDELEGNITTSVISSYNENKAAGFYTDIVEEEKTGEVFEITEENFTKEVLKSSKKVLVEFYADWCSPCKTLSPILEEIAKENLDLKVVKINVDENSYIASQYGANYIPLLVVIEDGKEIDSAVGALPKKDILELVK